MPLRMPISITIPKHYFTKSADVIVYLDDQGRAVAVNRHGERIAGPSQDHTEVIEEAKIQAKNKTLAVFGTFKSKLVIDVPITLIGRADFEVSNDYAIEITKTSNTPPAPNYGNDLTDVYVKGIFKIKGGLGVRLYHVQKFNISGLIIEEASYGLHITDRVRNGFLRNMYLVMCGDESNSRGAIHIEPTETDVTDQSNLLFFDKIYIYYSRYKEIIIKSVGTGALATRTIYFDNIVSHHVVDGVTWNGSSVSIPAYENVYIGSDVERIEFRNAFITGAGDNKPIIYVDGGAKRLWIEARIVGRAVDPKVNDGIYFSSSDLSNVLADVEFANCVNAITGSGNVSLGTVRLYNVDKFINGVSPQWYGYDELLLMRIRQLSLSRIIDSDRHRWDIFPTSSMHPIMWL